MPEKTLRMESAMPLYVQLMERIQNDIRSGIYPVGDQIPTEHGLEARYGVSRVTVRRALSELTAMGLLERKQGKGTFVSQPKQKEAQRDVQGFHDACREMGMKPSVGLVRFREMPAAPEDRKALNLLPETKVIDITRVLLADGIPVILEINHFSTAYAWLGDANLKGSLYRVLQEYGIRAEKSIYDFSLKSAFGEEAALLQIEEGTAVMVVDQVVYDQRGRPLHTSHQLIRGEKYTLRI